MNAGAELPVLRKSALFGRLALGRAAGVTVVTPNKRLSQALMLEFDAFQIGKALSVWEAPDILPFGAFVRWLTHYKKKTENDLDAPRLPDALQRFLSELKRPKLVVAYAFDILPPQTKEFLDALGTEIAFCRPDPRSATVSRAAFESAKHEIEAAARWARARLEAGDKRIGVVVPSGITRGNPVRRGEPTRALAVRRRCRDRARRAHAPRAAAA